MARLFSPLFQFFAVIFLFGAFAAPLAAQTATNLKCKGCVGKRDLGKKAVRGKNIKNNTITGAKIRDGSIFATDLAASAKPTGADSDEGPASAPLALVPSVVRSVTISAPTDGLVIAIGSGFFAVSSSSVAVCTISLDNMLDDAHEIKAASGTDSLNIPYSGSRLFEVTAGDTMINLVCAKLSGTATAFDSALTAFFVPNRY